MGALLDGVNAGVRLHIVAVVCEVEGLSDCADFLRRQKVFVTGDHRDLNTAGLVDRDDFTKRFLFTGMKKSACDEADVIADMKWLEIAVESDRSLS